MKKIIVIIAAILVLMACNKENVFLESPTNSVQETSGIKVNLTITRSDDITTKATVKSAYANNDVVFVFFKGVTAPKYLEMKYNSSSDTWIPTAKNNLTSSDISGAADRKMTAIYLPYGSAATVAASEGNFIFSDMTYSGYFLKAEQVDYTFDENVLSGSLSMMAPTLSNNSDKLIHFDISGFTSGHNYKLSQDYVKPLTFTSVSANGVLSMDEGTMGDAITGYEDGSMMSFSGILDASAVGNELDYQFTIDDLTSSTLYTRDAGTKTLSSSKYIGIGAINNAQWMVTEYVDLGLSVKWAKCNLRSATETKRGDFFAWGETYPKSNFSISTYKWYECSSNTFSLTKYCFNSDYGYNGFTDTKTTLDLEDDAAHVQLGGRWRMPTKMEMDDLHNKCTWTWFSSGNTEFNGVEGYKVTSNMEGYEDRFIFLPAAGYRSGTQDFGGSGQYWSSSLRTDSYPYFACKLFFQSNNVSCGYDYRDASGSIRPVYPLDHSELVTLNIDKNDLLMAINEEYNLITTVMAGDEIVDYPITWFSDNPSVATVSQEGLITALSEGTATITASYRYRSVCCSVLVEHELVDLGLSVKWATYNVGASVPEGYGGYYAWGEIETKNDYSWSTYKYGNQYGITKYNDDEEIGNVDNKYELEPEDDVAHVSWGGDWRMPSRIEFYELMRDCNWSWTSLNGVNGYLVTSKKAGYTNRSIFLPAAGCHVDASGVKSLGSYGYYWTSSHESGGYNQHESYRLGFTSSFPYYDNSWRCTGGSIRPVHP